MDNDWKRASGIGHVPLLWVVLPLMLGYSLANSEWLDVSPVLLATGSAVLALAALAGVGVAILRLWPWVWGTLFVLAVTLLAWAYWLVRVGPPHEGLYPPPREVEMVVVVERLFQGRPEWRNVSGMARVTEAPPLRQDLQGQRLYFSLRPGDHAESILRGAHVKVRGRLRGLNTEGPESGFIDFLTSNGIYHRLDLGEISGIQRPAPFYQRWASSLNQRFRSSLRLGVDSEQSGHLAGISEAMLLGRKQALDEAQRERFLESGTMHLFAVSGLHVGIIAAALGGFFNLIRVPRRWAAVIGLIMVGCYVLVVGAPPSAVRAFLMTAFFWGALAVVRKPAALPALMASALVVLLWDPREMLRPGFQLSYAVVGGILLYGLPLACWLCQRLALYPLVPEMSRTPWQRMQSWLWQGLLASAAVSFAATLFSSPLTIDYFGIFTPGAILLNIVLLPLASLAIVVGAVSMVTGSMGLILASGLLNYVSWGLNFTLAAFVNGALRLPLFFSGLTWRWDGWAGAALWVMFLGFAVSLHRVQARSVYFLLPPLILTAFLVTGVKFVHAGSS